MRTFLYVSDPLHRLLFSAWHQVVQDALYTYVEKVVTAMPKGPHNDCIACVSNTDEMEAARQAASHEGEWAVYLRRHIRIVLAYVRKSHERQLSPHKEELQEANNSPLRSCSTC